MKKGEKKLTYILRFGMTCLTVILIVLFFLIMSMVSKIQGTARVINYAGLVRGGTQRMVKLEISGQPSDMIYETITSYIEGLRYGSDELNFVRLEDAAFQSKMAELEDYFGKLREEVLLVRANGYEQTDIIDKSETFFKLCDETVGLAETYSQKIATTLDHLEKVVMVDISGLIILIAIELIRALRFAAQNRILQKKVYLDEATGLPNKNKCEEILNQEEPVGADALVAMCVFDLNNLRIINNNLGHDKGDAYIKAFGELLRANVPEEHFVGRDGGDEFIAVLNGMQHEAVEALFTKLRAAAADYAKAHPDMPMSFAAGYALSSDFENVTLRELFRNADKNMYIDKNQAKMAEAAQKQQMNIKLLKNIKAKGFHFSDCLYCDALLDQYNVLRASTEFFLADDGSYSGAVEQVVQRLAEVADRKDLRNQLQLEYLSQHLNTSTPKLEWSYQYTHDDIPYRGRMTVLYVNSTEEGKLHHFIMGFENFQNLDDNHVNEQRQLARYYEQLKQSLSENTNYVEALLDSAEAVYMVDLTNNRLEHIFYHTKVWEFGDMPMMPCSYDEYCNARGQYVTEETLENYRIVDSAQKLLERFASGTKQVTVEYRENRNDDTFVWLQKTVLMSRDTVYDRRTNKENSVVHGIILFKNTSVFHEKDQQEKERLQLAYEEADSENKAKTEFMNRMSHDIRTPINGIMGMVDIIRKYQDDPEKLEEGLDKIQLSTRHLLALVNDVLDMSKLEAGQSEMTVEAFDLNQLMDEVAVLVDAQIVETGLVHRKHRKKVKHTKLLGSSLQLRRIMLNLLSNAIKYNRPEGSIDTYAEELSDDGTTVWYEFKIEDTGVGMSEDFVEHQLFKPFTQEKNDARTQYRGTGLGMSIVKGLIESMNGTIEVHSVLDEGTVFVFRMPFEIDKNVEDNTEQMQKTDVKSIENLRILLVEDNEINMEVAEFYLTENGAKVDKAWNGEEALEKFEASQPGTYDVILMDVMMPVMDGIEAAKRLRRLNRSDAKSICILAMTAQTSGESIKKCLAAGMNGHIAKPIEVAKLLEAINTAK